MSSRFQDRGSFSARSLDEQTNGSSSRKGRLMGEARRRQRDQGTMWERWNLPTISTGPPGRAASDLQDSASSWETRRLRLTATGVTGNERGVTFLRNLAEGFHTSKHQQLHRC